MIDLEKIKNSCILALHERMEHGSQAYPVAGQLLSTDIPTLMDTVRKLHELLDEFVDRDEPCSFDHHGYCQAHCSFGDSCLHADAIELLDSIKVGE